MSSYAKEVEILWVVVVEKLETEFCSNRLRDELLW